MENTCTSESIAFDLSKDYSDLFENSYEETDLNRFFKKESE